MEGAAAGSAVEVLEPTAGHPLYSLTRGDWVKAGELRPGERLQTQHGPAQVVSLTATPGAQRVFNFEVEGEHEYLVGGLGVRSHNASTCAPGAPKVTPPAKNPTKPSSKKLRQEMEQAGRTVGPDEAAHHIVPGADKRAAPARARLEAEGVPINGADNGVGLPKHTKVPNPDGKAVHSTLHTNDYMDRVNDAITKAPPGKAAEVLADLRSQLESGGLTDAL